MFLIGSLWAFHISYLVTHMQLNFKNLPWYEQREFLGVLGTDGKCGFELFRLLFNLLSDRLH